MRKEITEEQITNLMQAIPRAEEVDRLRAENERLTRQRDKAWVEVERLRAALEMVRDADNDCRVDGLATIPDAARRSIDEALEGKP